MNQSVFDQGFAVAPVIAIMRGLEPGRAVAMCEAAWSLGIHLVEVTVESPAGLEGLAAVAQAGARRHKPVGAGTVTSPALVREAAAAGAAFTVAPGWDPTVARASEAAGMAHLPGVATATEVMHAMNHGCRWMKMFPASVLGVAWAAALRGPFPRARFVATGGIDVDGAERLLDGGVDAVGLGSALTDPGQRGRLSRLVARAPLSSGPPDEEPEPAERGEGGQG